MENIFIKAAKENQAKAEKLNARWAKGDRVRVLKSLKCNVHAVTDYLGAICTVVKVNKHVGVFSSPRIEYILQLGARLEPFWEDELDQRFKSN